MTPKSGTQIIMNLFKKIEEDKKEPHSVRCEIYCPECNERHIDKDEWATPAKAHRKHLCEYCGHIWKHKDYYTVGV